MEVVNILITLKILESPVGWRVVDYTEAIHFDGLSAFRPCGRDLVEFFNSTGWAFYVQ